MGNWVRNILEIKGKVLSTDFFEKTSEIKRQHEFKIVAKRPNHVMYSFGSNKIPCFELVRVFSYNYPDLTFTLNYHEILDDIMGKTIYKQGDIQHEEVSNFEHYGIKNPYSY